MSRSKVILVIDDDRGFRGLLTAQLADMGYDTTGAASWAEASACLKEIEPDLILLDMKLPDTTPERAVPELAAEYPVIVLTGYGSIRSAVSVINAGALDYLTKPVSLAELELTIARVLDNAEMRRSNALYKRQLAARQGSGLIGNSAAILALESLIDAVAPTNATVLIHGESGSGKEVVASAIHQRSERKNRELVTVDATTLSETLFESELFGHERGAFTGAVKEKRGLFKEADGGTLFLDEIGETSLAMQVKLLQALQERVVRRVGGNVEEPVDVRIICATNKDLARKVAEKAFREDFYYRIAVIPLLIPPLRERREDIPTLVRHFLKKVSAEQKLPEKRISTEAMRALEAHAWPGNVRELENLIERTVALEPGPIVTTASLPESFLRPPGVPEEAVLAPFDLPVGSFSLEQHLQWIGSRLMQQALDRAAGVQTEAAKLVGMSERSFRYYAKKYGLRREEEEEPCDEPGPAVDEA